MLKKEEILGKYKTQENKASKFSNKFELQIYEINSLIRFNFIMMTTGTFGVIGKKWHGKGILHADHLELIIETETDWTYIKADDETVEYTFDNKEILPIKIYTDKALVVVYHKDLDKSIFLNKII